MKSNPTKSVQRKAAINFLQSMIGLHKAEREMYMASQAVRFALSSQSEFERLDDVRDQAFIILNNATVRFNASRDYFVKITAHLWDNRSTDEGCLIDQANEIINSIK
jgi:hypothetical protein